MPLRSKRYWVTLAADWLHLRMLPSTPHVTVAQYTEHSSLLAARRGCVRRFLGSPREQVEVKDANRTFAKAACAEQATCRDVKCDQLGPGCLPQCARRRHSHSRPPAVKRSSGNPEGSGRYQLPMEAEEDPSEEATQPVYSGTSSRARTASAPQHHDGENNYHQRLWVAAGDLAWTPPPGLGAVHGSAVGARASLADAAPVRPAAATAGVVNSTAAAASGARGSLVVAGPDPAAAVMAGVMNTTAAATFDAVRASPAALLPAGGPRDVCRRAAAAASCAFEGAAGCAYSHAKDSSHLAAATQECGEKKSSGSLCPSAPGAHWWSPSTGTEDPVQTQLQVPRLPVSPYATSEWSEREERAAVVSRVLQVLRCKSLLREARKALQSAQAGRTAGEADTCTAADAEQGASDYQRRRRVVGGAAARGSPAGGDRTTAGNNNRLPAGGAADGVAGGEAASASIATTGGMTAAGALLMPDVQTSSSSWWTAAAAVTTETDNTAPRASREPNSGASCGGGLTQGWPVAAQSFVPEKPAADRPAPAVQESSNVSACCWQEEQKRAAADKIVSRRSVWMRGERSEDDLRDDNNIKALRALIPELLVTVPEWLDTKLDTGRRGEWLGFEKVLPSILKERFGFTAEELRKDGPFCWKGKRRARMTEVPTLLQPTKLTPQAAARFIQYTEEAERGPLGLQRGLQYEHGRGDAHVESDGRQISQRQLDVVLKRPPQQHRAQEHAFADLLIGQQVIVGSIDSCDSRQHWDERQFEAMDVDEDESGEHSTARYSCRGSNDGSGIRGGDSCRSNSRGGNVAEPGQSSSPCGGQGSNALGGRAFEAGPAQQEPAGFLQREPAGFLEQEAAVSLETTSVWVNGLHESGLPYDVHVHAKVDGRSAADFYVEIKATVAADPSFVLSSRQLEFARSQGLDNYLVLVICSIRAASPAWILLDNVADRVSQCLHIPSPAVAEPCSGHKATASAEPPLPLDLKIRCRFEKQSPFSRSAARAQLTEQGVDDILWCLLKPSSQ